MSRDDRFKEMGKYAFPDHRLLPREVLEKIEKLTGNRRRFQKKIIRIAFNRMHADQESGAGFPIDQLLREFLSNTTIGSSVTA